MNQHWSGRILCLALAVGSLSACQLGESRSQPQDGERYFTWVDEQGRVRQSPIQQDSARKEDPTSIEQVVSQVELEQQEASPDRLSIQQAAEPGPEPTEVSGQPMPVDNAKSETPVAQRPLPAPEQARQSPQEQSRAAAPLQPANDEYSLANYPDGNELAAAGFVRDGDPEPYFTWRDAEGRMRVSYYRPDTRSAMEKGLVKPPLELTPAKVYLKTDRAPVMVSDELPEAFAVLGIEPPRASYFQNWNRYCCESLALIETEEWQQGREFSILIAEDSPSHEFVSGGSHYRLVQLPTNEEAGNFVLRIRSFDRDGLFVPSLAFLDTSLAPVRVVTDLVADFTPETWHSHGYLQALVPAFPEKGERWLLIYSTEGDQQSQTVIESDRGVKAVPHAATGYISLQSVTL